MKTETTLQGLIAALKPARAAQKRIGFVPTMGNLHDGHIRLVQEAKRFCDIVVVSIFVNPIQFGVGEDFDSYPRTLAQDSQRLAEAQCDIVFAPSVEQMYGNQPRLTNISVSEITAGLCGAARPGHFDGVAVVVAKLFNMVQPHSAYFGQKDYQQLAVIRQMVLDLNFPIEVCAVPIVRAEDGLALSSRNGYLSPEHRAIAPNIYAQLQQAAVNIKAGEPLADVLHGVHATLTSLGFAVDYVEARYTNLAPATQFDADLVLLVAAKIGKTRLIDNLEIHHKP